MNAGEADERGRGGPGTPTVGDASEAADRPLMLGRWVRIYLCAAVLTLLLIFSAAVVSESHGESQVGILVVREESDGSLRPVREWSAEPTLVCQVAVDCSWGLGWSKRVVRAESVARSTAVSDDKITEDLRRRALVVLAEQAERHNASPGREFPGLKPLDAQSAAMVREGVRVRRRGDLLWRLHRFAPRAIPSLFTVLALAVIGLVAEMIRRAARLRRLGLAEMKRCPRCGYDMTGCAGAVCPECGTDTAMAEAAHRRALGE